MLVIGLWGVCWPRRVAEIVHVPLPSPAAVLEARAVFGGVFIGLALVCLVTSDPYAYLAHAGFWYGSVGAKALAAVLDRPSRSETIKVIAYDAVFGTVLLSGFYYH